MTTFAFEPQSHLWKAINRQCVWTKTRHIEEPDEAELGWWIFNLGSNTWLQPAVEYHDERYIKKDCTKDAADVQFVHIAQQAMKVHVKRELEKWIAENIPHRDDMLQMVDDQARIDAKEWELHATCETQLALCWLAIRSPIGDLAWRT